MRRVSCLFHPERSSRFFSFVDVDRFVGGVGLVADMGVDSVIVNQESTPAVSSTGDGELVFSDYFHQRIGFTVTIRIA